MPNEIRRYLSSGIYMADNATGKTAAQLSNGQWMVLLAAFLGWMFDGLEMGIFPLIARPALMDMLQGNEALAQKWEGGIHALFLVGAALGGLVFGWLGDKIGRVKAMTYSVLAYSVFTGIGYFSQTPAQLGGLRFLAALGMGGEWSLGVALVMECWPENRRPILAGLIGAASNVGFALIAVLTLSFKVTQESWRWVLLAGIAPALLTVLIRLFVPESEKWHESNKKGPSNPVREVFSGKLLSSTLIGIVLASVALLGTWGSIQWIPSWVEKIADGSKEFKSNAKSLAQICSSLGAVVGCLIAPFLGVWMGRRKGYFLLCVSSLVVCLSMYLGMNQYSNALLGVIFLAGMTAASFYGWLPLYLPELFPTRVRATGQGVAFNTGRIIAAAGALSKGYLMTSVNGDYAKAGAVITMVYFVGMISIWFAPETKGKPLPE
ncbi:MAG: MFS transporter [Planctomycetota bacterium]